MCVGTPDAERAVQQVGGIVAEEHAAVEVGELAVEDVVRPQQRDDRLQVAVRHVADVEADQRGARRDRPRRGPALAPHRGHRRPRRAARALAPGRAHGDVEPDEQEDAEADQHEVERGDVVGVAQRDARRVGGEQPDDDQEAGHDRPGQHHAPPRRRRRARDRARRPGAAPGLATGLEQGPRRHQADRLGCFRSGAQVDPDDRPRQGERRHGDGQAGEVIEHVVPAEVDGGGDGEGEQDPHRQSSRTARARAGASPARR